VPSCVIKILPTCPATQLVGLSRVLLPASVTVKFWPTLKSTEMFVPSVSPCISATAAFSMCMSLPKSVFVPTARALTYTSVALRIPVSVPPARGSLVPILAASVAERATAKSLTEVILVFAVPMDVASVEERATAKVTYRSNSCVSCANASGQCGR